MNSFIHQISLLPKKQCKLKHNLQNGDPLHNTFTYPQCVQSSLRIFPQKYLRKCKDTYFILQNKYLRIYEDRFGVKVLLEMIAPNSDTSNPI